jgi:ribosomal-protein-alanine N-acetyltransferase
VTTLLLTERLSLREFVENDFDALREIEADPEVLHYRSRAEVTPAQTREFIVQSQVNAAEQPRQQYALAVVLRAEQRLIGQVGLTIVNSHYDEAFLWYSVNRGYWGQGYATEAAARLLRFGFDEAGLRRIFAECHPNNRASARVLEKIGMTPEVVADASRLRYGLTKADDGLPNITKDEGRHPK